MADFDDRATPGDLRVSPGMLFTQEWGVPRPRRVVYLVQQRDGDDWREVGRSDTRAGAEAEAERLRRVRAAILSEDPS